MLGFDSGLLGELCCSIIDYGDFSLKERLFECCLVYMELEFYMVSWILSVYSAH